MKKLLKKVANIAILFALVAPGAHAQPADHAYVSDATQSPNAVFDQGFRRTGQNRSLLDHVLGLSCNQPPGDVASSAFVAATSTTPARDLERIRLSLAVLRNCPGKPAIATGRVGAVPSRHLH